MNKLSKAIELLDVVLPHNQPSEEYLSEVIGLLKEIEERITATAKEYNKQGLPLKAAEIIGVMHEPGDIINLISKKD